MTTLEEARLALAAPFPIEFIELKPGTISKDKTRCLPMPYVDKRAYEDRLDEVVGPGNWSVSYQPWGSDAALCSLTILGVTKQDVGECNEPKDPNRATIIIAQAFKRACSSFGLGRYLYHLPKVWTDHAPDDFIKIPNARQVVYQMYAKAGLLKRDGVVVLPAAFNGYGAGTLLTHLDDVTLAKVSGAKDAAVAQAAADILRQREKAA